MDDRAEKPGTGACPHIDQDDPRCNSRFSLGRIDQAFCVCFGAYLGCPMYHRINQELHRARAAARSGAYVTITAHGHALTLRPTGT